MHIPLVPALQVVVAKWPAPGLLKFGLINLIAFALLFVSYHYCVRSTFIGQILNGRSYPFSLNPFKPSPSTLSPDPAPRLREAQP